MLHVSEVGIEGNEGGTTASMVNFRAYFLSFIEGKKTKIWASKNSGIDKSVLFPPLDES